MAQDKLGSFIAYRVCHCVVLTLLGSNFPKTLFLNRRKSFVCQGERKMIIRLFHISCIVTFAFVVVVVLFIYQIEIPLFHRSVIHLKAANNPYNENRNEHAEKNLKILNSLNEYKSNSAF